MHGELPKSSTQSQSKPGTQSISDENYAREVMQLFSIGLYELNPDGSLKRDGGGNLIDTYNNEDIKAFSRVFTGLKYAVAPGGTQTRFGLLPTSMLLWKLTSQSTIPMRRRC